MNVRMFVRALFGGTVAALPLLLALACSEDPTEAGTGEPAALVLSRQATFQSVGALFNITVRVTDSRGTRLSIPISAASMDDGIIAVDSTVTVPELTETRVFLKSLVFDTLGTDVVVSAGSLADTLTVISLPASLLITPAGLAVTVHDTTQVTVEGLDVDGVSFGPVPVDVTDEGDTLVVALLPDFRAAARAPGISIIEVTGPGGELTATSRFTVGAVPTIAALTPNSGPAAGEATVTGAQLGFPGVPPDVSVGGQLLGFVDVVSESEVNVVMPTFSTAGDREFLLTFPFSDTATATWTQTLPFNAETSEPANEDPGTPTTIGVPFEFSGAFGLADVDDWFVFRVGQEGTIAFELDWDIAKDLDLIVFNPDFSPADGAFDGEGCEGFFNKPETGDCHLTPGTYLLLLEDFTAIDEGDFAPVMYTLTGTFSR